MDEVKNKKLKIFLEFLKDQKNVLNVATNMIEESHYQQIERAILDIQSTFPDLLPLLKKSEFEITNLYWNKPRYERDGIRAYLSKAIPTIEAEISEDGIGTPITEKKKFDFISDSTLKNILERDYEEIQRVFLSSGWKSTIILAGSGIEAILLDALNQDRTSALGSGKAPKGEKDLSKWSLSDLISVAVDIKKVSSGVDKLSSSVREYRNLVHPGNELRNNIKFGKEESRIAIEVLNIVHRDLGS